MSLENLFTRIEKLGGDDFQKVLEHVNTLEKLRMAKSRLHDFVNGDFLETFADISIDKKILELMANTEIKEINEKKSLEYGIGSSKLYFPSISKTVVVKWEISMWTKHGVQWNHKRFYVYKNDVSTEQKQEDELYKIDMVHSEFENKVNCDDDVQKLLRFLEIDPGNTEYIQEELVEPIISGLFSIFEKYQQYDLQDCWNAGN